MHYEINDTGSYHVNEIESLGWELTVCNTLEPGDSPCRKFLQTNTSYGNLLYQFLGRFIEFSRVRNTIEIGGGYGFLMRDFLMNNPGMNATMLDISPFLLEKQKETLREFNVDFVEKNFLNCGTDFCRKFDLAVMNENLGDFPTVCSIDPEIAGLPLEDLDDTLLKVRTLIDKYILPVPGFIFHFNSGAIEAVEKLCTASVPYIFCAEHSCESVTCPSSGRGLHSGRIPERIRLKGHDEFTIQFSFLERVARAFGYTVTRGQVKDFIALVDSDELNFIMKSGSQKEGHEAVRQFVEDLYKYEYLILIKKK